MSGALTVGEASHYRFSPVGVEIIGKPTISEHIEAIQQLQYYDKMMPLWIGDMINQGLERFGPVILQAVGDRFEHPQTPINRASIARRVTEKARVPGLPISYYEAVAVLHDTPKTQKDLLEKAAQKRDRQWLRAAVRKLVKKPPLPFIYKGTCDAIIAQGGEIILERLTENGTPLTGRVKVTIRATSQESPDG